MSIKNRLQSWGTALGPWLASLDANRWNETRYGAPERPRTERRESGILESSLAFARWLAPMESYMEIETSN